MSINFEDITGENISRKELLSGAGKAVAGAAMVSMAGLGIGGCQKKSVTKYPWPYVKLDSQQSGDLAYVNWYKKFCCYAVASAILVPLQEKVGGPYTSLPVEGIEYRSS